MWTVRAGLISKGMSQTEQFLAAVSLSAFSRHSSVNPEGMVEGPLVPGGPQGRRDCSLAGTGREHHQSPGLSARTQQRGRLCAAAAPVFSSPEARALDEAFGGIWPLDHINLRAGSVMKAHGFITCVTLFSFTPRITGRNQHRLPAGLSRSRSQS